ncbi:MAG: hypothetical protein CL572_06895 [Alphaproteobacteria bacterium]|nr:hypothetical protein [Alphaproteobacteria bacterium]
MIHFIVATSSEAKTLIDFYKLKKKKTISNYLIYNNDIVSLTISGIGKINSAMSITHTFYEFNQQKNNIWINIGIAGHKKEKIGCIFLVDKIIDDETKKKKYPFIVDNCQIKQESCVTYNKENFNYTNNLSDMEASGFFFGCEKYSTKEFIHSLKIISDNEKEKINFFDKNNINNLIKKKIEIIDIFKRSIFSIWTEFFEKNNVIENKIESVLANYKLSFSEKLEFKKWLAIYLNSTYNQEDNIIDIKKDFQTNIKKIKEKLNA